MQPIFRIDGNRICYLQALPAFPPGFNATEQMSMLGADNDWDAVLEFLQQYADNQNTLASYTRETERFLLWLIHVADKPISAVNRLDWQDYLKFLATPPKSWCGPKVPKYMDEQPNPDWRPFGDRFKAKPLAKSMGTDQGDTIQGLSPSSVRLSQKIIESLFSFLVDNGHLNANPCTVSRTRRNKTHQNKRVVERSIDIELIDEVIDYCHRQQHSSKTKRQAFHYLRARYLIQLLVGTGLRLSESTGHTFGNIVVNKDEWLMQIIGKGDKPRSIVVFSDLKAIISEYRISLGFDSPAPLFGEQNALIPSSFDLKKPITPRRVDQILRDVFDEYAKVKLQIAQNETDTQKKGYLLNQVSILEKASPHWLRHTHATYYLEKSGGDLKSTMERLGHSDVSTTMLYLHKKQSVKEAP